MKIAFFQKKTIFSIKMAFFWKNHHFSDKNGVFSINGGDHTFFFVDWCVDIERDVNGFDFRLIAAVFLDVFLVGSAVICDHFSDSVVFFAVFAVSLDFLQNLGKSDKGLIFLVLARNLDNVLKTLLDSMVKIGKNRIFARFIYIGYSMVFESINNFVKEFRLQYTIWLKKKLILHASSMKSFSSQFWYFSWKIMKLLCFFHEKLRKTQKC